MQVTTEQIDPCKIALTITVEADKVNAAKEKAFLNLAKNVQVPGFRKGKVPPAMARAYVDPERIAQKAAETLWKPNYQEALTETQTEPFADPELEFISIEGDFVFKALVPLRPVVTLGPYKGLDVEKRKLLITDKDVEKQLDEVKTRYAEYPEIKDRNVERGDVILADLMAFVEDEDGSEFTEPRSTVIEIGKNIEDFDNGLVGMAAGETKTIEANYPADYTDERLQGKKATFTVTVKEIRNKILPEVTEEFVQKVHPTAKTVEEFNVAMRESLEKAAEQMAENDLEFRIVGEIVKNSQINFPEVLLNVQMQADGKELEDRLKQQNVTLEQYLESRNQTIDDLRQEVAISAAGRIRNSLVLAEVARTEGITVEDADIDAQLAERAERAKIGIAAVRAFAEKNNQMTQIRDQALTTKILKYLKETSNVNERSLTEEEWEAIEAEEDDVPSDPLALDVEDAPVAEAVPLAVETTTPKRRSKKTAKTEETEEAEAEPVAA